IAIVGNVVFEPRVREQRTFRRCVFRRCRSLIPMMAITIPSDADHRRSEATLGISYHAELIGIRQSFCDRSEATLGTTAGKGARGKGAAAPFPRLGTAVAPKR